MRFLCILALSWALTGCTTFNSIKAIKPDVGFGVTEVTVQNPVFRWEAIDDYSGTYDLIVLTNGKFDRWGNNQSPQRVIYEKKGIAAAFHKIKIPLENNYSYTWSVKRSDKYDKDAWANYNFYLLLGVVNIWNTNVPFNFKTTFNSL